MQTPWRRGTTGDTECKVTRLSMAERRHCLHWKKTHKGLSSFLKKEVLGSRGCEHRRLRRGIQVAPAGPEGGLHARRRLESRQESKDAGSCVKAMGWGPSPEGAWAAGADTLGVRTDS